MKDILPLKRLFINTELKTNALIALSSSNTHYIINVLRMRGGENISIFNGKQGEWKGCIKSLTKKKAIIKIGNQIKEQKDEELINIIYTPIKGQRHYYLIEKITELGVNNIFPIFTDHSVIKKVNFKKINSCLISAAQQSGRLSIPEFHQPQYLNNFINSWDSKKNIIFCDESKADLNNNNFLSKIGNKNNLNTILIGPEGGFSKKEKNYLIKKKFIISISLGNRILRSDTAAKNNLSFFLKK